MAKKTTKAATTKKVVRKVPERRGAKDRPASTGGKVKMAPLSVPPEEMFVDGVSGLMSRAGIVKIDLFRVTGYDRREKAEVHTITQRLVMPVNALPELVRLAQDLVKKAGGKA